MLSWPLQTRGGAGDAKSGKGRQIRLTRYAMEALKRHRKRQLEVRMKLAGLWQDQGLVFPSQAGTPLSARNLIPPSRPTCAGPGSRRLRRGLSFFCILQDF